MRMHNGTIIRVFEPHVRVRSRGTYITLHWDNSDGLVVKLVDGEGTPLQGGRLFMVTPRGYVYRMLGPPSSYGLVMDGSRRLTLANRNVVGSVNVSEDMPDIFKARVWEPNRHVRRLGLECPLFRLIDEGDRTNLVAVARDGTPIPGVMLARLNSTGTLTLLGNVERELILPSRLLVNDYLRLRDANV